MSKNPGNSGHKGYQMSKITAITPQNGKIVISLACGHTYTIDPYPGETAEAWAAHLQQGDRPFVVGKSRARCENH